MQIAKSRAAKGEPEAFLRAYVNYVGDECVNWPFHKGDQGYGIVQIDGVQKTASRWMCILANGEPPSPGHEAAHSCGNRPCINRSHLGWKTRVENQADRKIHGTTNRGERSPKTRLTEEDVRAIRADERPHRIIAADYGISRQSVSNIQTHQRWGHI